MNTLPQRKIIIIAAFVIILILFVIIIITSQSNPALPPTTPTITPTAIMKVSESPSIILPKWNTFTGQGYSFQYPFDWSIQKNDIEGGGEMLTVKPSVLPDGIFYPAFILEREPFRAGRAEERISILKALGLIESETVVLNRRVKKLSGTIFREETKEQVPTKPIQETVILLTYKDSIYTFKYQYEGSRTSKDLEEYFNDFISTIRFQ